MITKYANVEKILDVKTTQNRLEFNPNFQPGDNLNKFAGIKEESDTGYLYVRCRAISSRTNKNGDSWPSAELKKAHRSFIGRPIFVDHNNDDPKRTRGVVIDARLHEEDINKLAATDDYYQGNPDPLHLPPTWIEVLMEIDAKTFPKLANAIKKGDIDAVSMGANVAWTVCNICGNKAESPDLYCGHIKDKGIEFEIVSGEGRHRKKSYEHCYFGKTGGFFELSNVFDPADETALYLEKAEKALAKVASKEAKTCPDCNGSNVDKVLKEEWDNDNLYSCLDCNKNYRYAADVYDYEQDDSMLGDGEEYNMPQPNIKDPYLQEYYQAPEEDRIIMYKVEQLTGMGFPPEEAQEYARTLQGYKWGEFMRLIENKWPPDLAYRTVASIKQAVPMDTAPNQEYDRQLNYKPQSDQITAPEKVNTLRDDPLCPNCKSDSLIADPDGTQKCPSCSWVQPPTGLDNPDLSMHKKFQEGQEEHNSPVNHEEDLGQINIVPNESLIEPVEQINPVSPIKSNNSTEGINRMKWSTLYNGAVVETTIENPEGLGNKTFKKLRELGLTAKVIYPSGEELNIPFDAPAKGMILTLKAQNEGQYETFTEIPIVVEANTKDIDTVLDVIHTGAATPSVKKIINPHIQTKTDDPKGAKIISDQTAPVTSNNEENMEEKVSDKKTVRHEEELPDGAVKRTEEIIETDEDEEVKKSSVEDVEKKYLTVFALADDFVEAGLVPKDEKFVLIARLEEESMETLKGRKATLDLVRQAGLSKPTPKTAGLPRIPNLSSFEMETEVEEEIPFEAIFNF